MRARKVVLILVVAVAVLSSGFVSASGEADVPAAQTTIVRAYYPDLATGNKVLIAFEPQLLETNYEAGYHVMAVTQEEIERLEAYGLRVVPDPKWVAPPVLASLPAGIQTIPGYSCYRTVEETYAAAQALVTAHPDLATWVDVGNSWQKSAGQGGYDMMILKLTNSAIPGPKPKLLLTAAIHAREYATAELVTRFGEYLVNNYGVDADATWILDQHEVHLMLQSNPDGRKKAETGLSWRKNTNNNYCANSNSRGADLNRNFAFQWGCCGGSSGSPCNETYRGPSAASEPETQAVQAYMDLIFPDQRGPNLTDPAPADATGVYVDIHSYGRLVLWPWGFTSGQAPNATALQTLGRKYAYWNSHTPQQAYALYATDGTTDDHAYGKLGVASYCFETGTAFFQSCTYFQNTLWPANLPSLIYAAKVVRTPYMTPAGPDAINLALSSSEVPEGTPVTLNATIDDTRYNNTNGTEPTQNIAAAEYYVDVPPWGTDPTAVAMAASDGSFGSKTEGVTATVDTTGLSDGKHLLFVRGKDASGNWGAFSAVLLSIVDSDNQPPVADPQSAVTAEDTAAAITLTGSDPDGDALTFSVTSGPSHGTLSGTGPNRTYTPAANYNGPDAFNFVANDGHLNSPAATVSLTVTPVNDAPAANPQSVTTQQDTPVGITLTGSDVDGDPLSFSIETGPSHGTLSGSVPNLTYTPAAGYTGSDSFAFTVSDGAISSPPATVSITVNPPGPVTVFSDDFETNKGWTRNPNGSDTATLGLWERADPQATNSSGPKQLGTTVSGSYDLVTGPLAGSSAGSYDIDGGVTSIRSPNFTLPAGKTLTLTLKYYLAHGNNSSSADYLRVKVVGLTTSTVLQELGAANFSGSLNSFAGQTVYLLVEAADASGASLVEAAVDDVLIVAQ
jgi:carboxypeptidase T